MDTEQPPTITPEIVIKKLLAIREEGREDKKAFDAREAERDRITTLGENFLLGVMNDRKERQIATEDGTAFKKEETRVTMADRDQVLGYVCDELEKGVEPAVAFSIFTNHVSKEAVKDLADRQIIVPGVKVDRFTVCRIRKA